MIFRTEEPIMEKEKEFEKYYKSILTVCVIVIAAAIAVAVFYKVSLGIVIGIVGVLLYALLVNQGLKNRFGLGYRRNGDGVSVFSKGGAREIPSRLLFLEVTEIEAGKESFGETLRIPRSVRRVDAAALMGVRTVEYVGTEEEWSRVELTGDRGEWDLVFIPAENEEKNESET